MAVHYDAIQLCAFVISKRVARIATSPERWEEIPVSSLHIAVVFLPHGCEKPSAGSIVDREIGDSSLKEIEASHIVGEIFVEGMMWY